MFVCEDFGAALQTVRSQDPKLSRSAPQGSRCIACDEMIALSERRRQGEDISADCDLELRFRESFAQ